MLGEEIGYNLDPSVIGFSCLWDAVVGRPVGSRDTSGETC